jgi:TPR repeat protein
MPTDDILKAFQFVQYEPIETFVRDILYSEQPRTAYIDYFYIRINNLTVAEQQAMYNLIENYNGPFFTRHLILRGIMWERGLGVAQDYRQARACYEQALEHGDVLAGVHLGLMYQAGRGVAVNLAQAYTYLKQSADADCAVACRSLIYVYRQLKAIDSDATTLFYAKKAIRLGLHSAYLDLGNMSGGHKEDYERAAKAGEPEALRILGDYYRDGCGYPENPSKAEEYYTEAAKRNNVKAFISLGIFMQYYMHNSERALEYFMQAVREGSSHAFYYLALLYGSSGFRPRSLVHSECFILLALQKYTPQKDDVRVQHLLEANTSYEVLYHTGILLKDKNIIYRALESGLLICHLMSKNTLDLSTLPWLFDVIDEVILHPPQEYTKQLIFLMKAQLASLCIYFNNPERAWQYLRAIPLGQPLPFELAWQLGEFCYTNAESPKKADYARALSYLVPYAATYHGAKLLVWQMLNPGGLSIDIEELQYKQALGQYFLDGTCRSLKTRRLVVATHSYLASLSVQDKTYLNWLQSPELTLPQKEVIMYAFETNKKKASHRNEPMISFLRGCIEEKYGLNIRAIEAGARENNFFIQMDELAQHPAASVAIMLEQLKKLLPAEESSRAVARIGM